MEKLNTNLCDTCPSRGLCVGEVALGVAKVTYGEGANTFPGYHLKVTDSDGVTETLQRVIPEEYTVTTRKSSREERTDHRIGVRSNMTVDAIRNNADALLGLVQDRANRCPGPDLVLHKSGFAVTYERICRVTDEKVLEALVARSRT